MNELQHFLNSTRCVTIPNKRNEECNHLVRDNFLSEYVTSEDKLKVLDNLGILRYLENILNNINNNLNLYVPLEYLELNFVKKRDVYFPYDGSGDYYGDTINESDSSSSNSSYIPGSSLINIDDELSLVSTNPVLNSVITRALIEKADSNILELYTKFVDLVSYLKPYQKELVAGSGITIDKNTNTISVTLDINPFVVVDDFPQGDDINPNKIYIIKRGAYYILYKYTQNGWIELGRDYSLNINMSDYYTKRQADDRYMLKTQYSEIEEYVLTYVTGLLKQYIKKSDVYTPYYGNEDNPDGGGSSGGNSSGGGNSGGGTSYNIVVDSTLSAYSENPVKNSVLYQEFLKKADATDVQTIQQNYVSKDYLTQTLLDYNLQGKLKTINGLTIIGTGNIQISLNVDNELSSESLNPVLNRVLKSAIDSKVDTTLFQSALALKQNVLIAGLGIDINGSIISVSIDTNPFAIVDETPLIGETSKIYLVKNGQLYDQYVYTNENGWELKGTIDFSVDLSNYLKSSDAYLNFVTNSALTTQLGGYATTNYVDLTFVTKAEANFSTNQQLAELRNYVDLTFLRKDDVYTENGGSIVPGGGGGSSSGGETITVNDTYDSLIPDGTRTNVTVGNILQGTDISSLKDLSFTQLFDMILFKEIWPVANYEHNISLGILPTVVKVGDPVVLPSVLAIWNTNILPLSEITYNLVQSVQGDTYENVGTETFTLNYSYPAGTYTITSNYGNTREIEKQAKQGTMTRTVKVTYPWYLNNIEQSVLVPINTDYTLQVALTGSPSIAIPGLFSSCLIQANLGLGFMDVTNWTRTTTEKNGITYSVWTKPDAYLQNVEHKITFNISL